MNNLSDGTGYTFEEEIPSMADISTIPRLPGDGAPQIDDPENIEQEISALPSIITINDDAFDSKQNPYRGKVKSGENQPPLNNEVYSAFKRGNVVKGILCPSLTNSFRARSLERSYLTYSHRQRQKSLLIVNIVDLILKLVLAAVWTCRKSAELYINETSAVVLAASYSSQE
ncbi:adenylyl cyclase 78C-like [Sitodiplosis mosellana]|uniref:adenylyl cyclase 78C-like n=1 Tax=Sitodiplosis mosellana TaxID=263140 RepID=UPI0024446562|nr:adenylyl cyclase 78C-like [Sitodiplosis mosellana]